VRRYFTSFLLLLVTLALLGGGAALVCTSRDLACRRHHCGPQIERRQPGRTAAVIGQRRRCANWTPRCGFACNQGLKPGSSSGYEVVAAARLSILNNMLVRGDQTLRSWRHALIETDIHTSACRFKTEQLKFG
jgi:hypothetical protein